MATKKRVPYSTPTSQESLLAHAKKHQADQARKPTAAEVHSAEAARRRAGIVKSIPGLQSLVDALTAKPKKKKP